MKERASVQFTYGHTYTLRRPKFKLFKNVAYLDIAKLSRGSHSIELGKFEGCHCDCAVTADVRNGMIKKINHPRCEKARKIPSALAKRIRSAGKELAKGGPRKWHDIPVHQLARRAGRAGIVIVITILEDCYEICVDPGSGQKVCWMCCPDLGWCIGPSDPQIL